MSSKYPVCRSAEVCAVLEKARFIKVSSRGSHVKYSNGKRIVIVPMHRKDLKTGTLKGILEQADISVEEFNSFL